MMCLPHATSATMASPTRTGVHSMPVRMLDEGDMILFNSLINDGQGCWKVLEARTARGCDEG